MRSRDTKVTLSDFVRDNLGYVVALAASIVAIVFWMQIRNMRTEEKAKEIIGKLGHEQVMFGTDYPVMNTPEELERFFRIDLTDKQREDILWNNAMRFLAYADEFGK